MLAFVALSAAGCADQKTPLEANGAALLAKGGTSNSQRGQQPMIYTADLMPLNNSGVTGTARLMFAGSAFKAQVHAKGLVPNVVHPQHVHFLARCPPASAAGPDGLLTIADGLPFYGEIFIPLDDQLVPLTANGFPTSNPAGVLNYSERTGTDALVTAVDAAYPGKQTLDSIDLQDRVVVIHGAFVKDNRVVAPGTVGAEYQASLPVACGEISQVK